MEKDMIFGTAIFNPAFDFSGPHLVAASAGTGKTYNIQNICARLVAEKGYPVSAIQVMTFTEAATKELRDRIRRVLSNYRRYLDEDSTFCPSAQERKRLESLKTCALGNLKAARRNLTQALVDFDQAAISTIHGFCRRVLARYAFETGNPFSSELGDADSSELNCRVQDWWRTLRHAAPEEVRDKLDLKTLRKYARALAGRPEIVIAATQDTPAGYMLAEADKIARRYREDRVSRSTQTFDDLLLALRDALRVPESGARLASQLRGEFKAALVDEFQDTDPVQYEIFERIFLDPAANPRPPLFLVGDPKQAIYSFRGGDIFTYRAAAMRQDVAKNTYRLDRNYRSTPRLIDAVNDLFMDKLECYTFGDKAIGYPVELLSDDKPALQVDGKDDPQPFRVVEIEGAGQMSAAIVDTVLTLLADPENKITPRDIAILVSSHKGGYGYATALRERGVPVVLQQAGNVFNQEVAHELRIVLQAMALEGGVGLARAALLTRFFDFTPQQLSDDSENQLVADMLGFFGELNALWLRQGFEVAFRRLAQHPRCDIRRRFSAMPLGERLLADLLQIEDLAVKAIRTIGPTPEDLIGWLTDRINNAAEGGAEEKSEEFSRELESESDAVRIMTMHVSKGLEFPIALIPLPSQDGRQSGPHMFHDGENRLVVTTERGEKSVSEAHAERTRLLYVAMTRATRRTVVFCPNGVTGSWAVVRSLFNNARERGQKRGSSPIRWSPYVPIEPPPPNYMCVRPNADELKKCPDDIRIFSADTPSKGSYSSLSPSGHGNVEGFDFDSVARGRSEQDEGSQHPIFSFSGGAKVGTCWHEILEKLPFDANEDQILRDTRRALQVHGLAKSDAEAFESDVKLVADMIGKTLDFRLTAPDGSTFSLRDVDVASRFSEWEFHFPSSASAVSTKALQSIIERHWKNDDSKAQFLQAMDGWDKPIPKGFLKGYLDLLFRYKDIYYVVDWKSNQIGRMVTDFSEEGVRTEMADAGYFFQYLLYCVVLHRFLKETLGATYSWNRHFGGARYYFLRGIVAGGASPVFADRPSEALLDDLAAALGMKEVA